MVWIRVHLRWVRPEHLSTINHSIINSIHPVEDLELILTLGTEHGTGQGHPEVSGVPDEIKPEAPWGILEAFGSPLGAP